MSVRLIKFRLKEALENAVIKNLPHKIKYWVFMSVFAEVWKDTNENAPEMFTLNTINYYGKKHKIT